MEPMAILGPMPPTPPLRYKLHQVLDRQHQNVVAAVFEIPQDWTAKSEVQWNYQNTSHPMIAYAQTVAPSGIEMVNFFPIEAYSWFEPNWGMLQPGGNSLGKTLQPPMPAGEALRRFLIPKYRGKSQGLKIMSVVAVPGIAKALGMDPGSLSMEEAGATIEYDERGIRMHEEFYAIKWTQQVQYVGPQGLTIETSWFFPRFFSIRTAKDKMQYWKDCFWRIVKSVQVNPAWNALCAQINQQLAVQFQQFLDMGYSQIQAAGQMSRAISANNDAMLRSFEQQRIAAAHTRVASPGRSASGGFDEYIRGVETLSDPYQGTSQQDNTYQYHWTDGSGTYQHSNDPFFNPNIGGNVNWSLMERPGGR